LIPAESTSLTIRIPAIQLHFEREADCGIYIAHLSNGNMIPLSEAMGLKIECDDEVVIRADSVKKKRKRKMNKHKLRKLRKKLRRKT
jgi:Mitochondrial domain of unknown function (DUF1713)